MIPPASSAFDLNLEPKTFPISTPAPEKAAVTAPISNTAGHILTFKKANIST